MNPVDDSSNGSAPPPPEPGETPPAADESQLAAAPEPVESAEQRMGRLERERAEAHDRMLRIAADFENYKRRVKRDMEESSYRTKEQLLKEVLPVLDNLDRALVAATRGGSVEALSQGVKLVEKQLLSGLEKFGVKAFDSLGQPFDPARHEAIQHVESAEHPAGTVATEFARGYLLGERLLRPAMVAVAKGPPAEPETREGAHEGGEGGGDQERANESGP